MYQVSQSMIADLGSGLPCPFNLIICDVKGKTDPKSAFDLITIYLGH